MASLLRKAIIMSAPTTEASITIMPAMTHLRPVKEPSISRICSACTSSSLKRCKSWNVRSSLDIATRITQELATNPIISLPTVCVSAK